MQLTLYRLSVWATGASYGSKLQDLKYAIPAIDDGRGARALTPLVACVLKIHERLLGGARSI
jgi:hypothetical protein